MSYQMIPGVTVRCDDCHAAAARGAQPIGVWPTTAVPLDELPGWQSQGHFHLCPECTRRRQCAASGHRFGPWAPSAERGRVPLVHHVCRVCGVERAAPAYCVGAEACPSEPLLAC